LSGRDEIVELWGKILVWRDEIVSGGTQRTASPTESTEYTKSTKPTSAAIPRIVHGLKVAMTKEIGFSIWQRSYYDLSSEMKGSMRRFYDI
jgi:hypothetical protein